MKNLTVARANSPRRWPNKSETGNKTFNRKARATNIPYQPGENFDPYRSASAGLALGQAVTEPLQKALEKYEQQKQQGVFNDTVFDYLKNVPGAVPVEALQRYHDMTSREKNGVILGAQFNAAKILSQREEQARRDMQWKIASMKDSPDPDAAKAIPLVAPDGTVIQGQFYNPGSKQIIKTIDPKAADDWKKLNTDSKAISGVGIGDWTRATNHRIENGMFTADLPGVPAPPGTPPAAVPFLSKPGRKLQMPTHEYDSLLSRYNQLSQRSGPLAAPASGGLPFDPSGANNPIDNPQPAAAATTSGKVRVRRPDGQVGMIPAAQLPAALAKGYTQAP